MMQNQSRSPSLSYSRSASFNRRAAVNVGSPRARLNVPFALGWFSRIQILPFVVGFLVTFLVAICAGYSLVVPSLRHTFHLDNPSEGSSSNSSVSVCNVFYGSWVQEESYPLYNASECPFAEQGFNCLANGRKDGDYLKLRWKPRDCDIPKFSVKEVLEWFRNRRIVFVGDSMSRTQWESLICFLLTGVEDKKSVYEVNGNKITKQIRFLGVRFNSFNFTVEFFRSVFLVQQGWKARHAPKRVKTVLRLDKLDDISNQWIDSDVLIFNTGQWWVPGKLFDTGCYFQVGESLKLGMSISTAFGAALNTWASWIDQNIDRNRTKVFIRTFEPSHWSDQTRRFCNVTQYPSLETEGRDKNILSDIVMETVKKMKDPVSVLNITSMSAFRSDAHVGFWSDKPFVPDCSHWCLPGVPDMWNEILLSYLLGTSQYLSGH